MSKNLGYFFSAKKQNCFREVYCFRRSEFFYSIDDWWHIFKRYCLLLICLNRSDEEEDCTIKQIHIKKIGKWIEWKILFNSMLSEKFMEKFISFPEVRSIISVVLNFLELILLMKQGGLLFYWEAVLFTNQEIHVHASILKIQLTRLKIEWISNE